MVVNSGRMLMDFDMSQDWPVCCGAVVFLFPGVGYVGVDVTLAAASGVTERSDVRTPATARQTAGKMRQ